MLFKQIFDEIFLGLAIITKDMTKSKEYFTIASKMIGLDPIRFANEIAEYAKELDNDNT
jgi:hypothetical protein